MDDDLSFQRHADEALTSLNRKLGTAGDEFGFESDLNDGALKIEFERPPAKFVISPNRPVHQIWVSALTRSFKLDWDETRSAFSLAQLARRSTNSSAKWSAPKSARRLNCKWIARSSMPGVYISFPFCSQKCTYCNFASGVMPKPLEREYLNALHTEIARHHWRWTPETVYIGGGTPASWTRQISIRY